MSERGTLDERVNRLRSAIWRWRWHLNVLLWLAVVMVLFFQPSIRNTDTLAISLTILEIFLVVGFIGGFWVYRQDVKDKAEEVAEREIDENLEPAVRRALAEWMSVESTHSSSDISELMKGLDQNDDNG